MLRKASATAVVAIGMGICAPGMAAGASSHCATVYAKGSDTSNPPKSLVAHVCDRVEVEFVFGTQGQIVPDWSVSRQPVKKVAKFVSKTFGGSDPTNETATQDFLFRTVGRGKTVVKFRETAPGYGELDSFTLKITVLARRRKGHCRSARAA